MTNVIILLMALLVVSKMAKPTIKRSNAKMLIPTSTILENIILTVEGGYYNPLMFGKEVKDSRYSNSDETMFGIDRKNADKILSAPFFQYLDILDKSKWKWNYVPKKESIEYKTLMRLAKDYYNTVYNQLSKKYLPKELMKIVEESNLLKAHFLYAVFNGSGWFQFFANKLKDADTTDVKKLEKIAIDSRKNGNPKYTDSANSLIAQSVNKIINISKN